MKDNGTTSLESARHKRELWQAKRNELANFVRTAREDLRHWTKRLEEHEKRGPQ